MNKEQIKNMISLIEKSINDCSRSYIDGLTNMFSEAIITLEPKMFNSYMYYVYNIRRIKLGLAIMSLDNFNYDLNNCYKITLDDLEEALV